MVDFQGLVCVRSWIKKGTIQEVVVLLQQQHMQVRKLLLWHGKESQTDQKKKKAYWMSTFIALDCTTTLPGDPAEKKRHDANGRRVTSAFVPQPKLVQLYYDGMPGTDIVCTISNCT